MTIWEIAFLFTYFSFLSMNNKFINNNGVKFKARTKDLTALIRSFNEWERNSHF
ncbi:MAG: hypothetical protein MRERV_22c024 [Mycoplasmataceae bacterium RV_VA103A]|nr:MAG: hypothetical protein MRERV_22c024 [Mycoplasmataceae bacterium RV_VA103A]